MCSGIINSITWFLLMRPKAWKTSVFLVAAIKLDPKWLLYHSH
jgi:hypothetical protein